MSYNESLDKNSNYPLMSQSEWDNAPWNQNDPEEKEFKVTVSQTLSKNTAVTTSDYIPGGYFPETEWDIDGYHTITCHEPDDTSDTDWKEAYKGEHLTPLQLIGEFKDFLTKYLPDPIIDIKGFQRHKYLIDECEGWTEDETEVIEE